MAEVGIDFRRAHLDTTTKISVKRIAACAEHQRSDTARPRDLGYCAV